MPKLFTKRDKLILAGLFLSKFDTNGLEALGFTNFSEAFNALALSIKAQPASLKNYRDEFDPYFPNPRRGWHGRPIREYCKSIMDAYGELNLVDFSNLVRSEISDRGDLALLDDQIESDDSNTFAKRLVTGQAAEKFFESVYGNVSYFANCKLVDTTGLGCGFDYKMLTPTNSYFAVEVKGMSGSKGTIQMTSKEYRIAGLLKDRYFLFVVRNFAEKPVFSVFRNPIDSDLTFEKRELVAIQISWTTLIG